jgi:hypothetical protein
MLKTVGKVEKGRLALGASKHSVVVLPGIERMPLESLRKLDAFVKEGGKLVAVRRAPSIVPGLNVTEAERSEFTAISLGLFNGSNASVKVVENDEDTGNALKSLLRPDVEISPSGKDFGFVHRRTDDADIYFIANTSNQKKAVQVTFRTRSAQAEVWNAMNGEVFVIDAQGRTNDSTTISLNFEPYQSRTVVFSKRSSPLPKMPANGTTASTLDLSSDWSVIFGKNPPIEMKGFRSWTDDDATRYFSGSAIYEKTFDMSRNLRASGNAVILDFGEGQALDVQPMRNGMRTWFDPPIREAAVVYINGQKAGSLWSPPYKLNITRFLKDGKNDVRIVVGNTAINHMAGRKLPDYKLLNLRYGERFQPQDMDKILPVPSGIIGTLKLVFTKK